MDELEALLAEEKETPAPASEVKPQEDKPDEEVLKKEQIKANLDKAILEAQSELKRIRKEKQNLKTVDQEEDLPRIDMDDPSAKAWNRHIQQQVNPVQSALDEEKAEIFGFALKEFLSDKPALASRPEKVKELITRYERMKESTGRTKEGVLDDLDRSYVATFHKEILNSVRENKIDKAKADILFSDIGVSKGATAYSSKGDNLKLEPLTADEKSIAIRWYGSEENYQKLKAAQKNK